MPIPSARSRAWSLRDCRPAAVTLQATRDAAARQSRTARWRLRLWLLSRAKVKGKGTQSPASMPLRTGAVTPRPYRPSLRQDRTPAGYAVKALLARSVLAFGCAPHAACGVSMTAPAGERPCLRGDRYTVSLQRRSVHHCFPGCSHAQTTPSGPVPAPTPGPRLPGAGIN